MNYLIVGNSYKLIDKEISKIVANREFKTYSLLEISLEEVLMDANYGSLFDDEKIIVLKNFETILDKKESKLETLYDYLNEPSPATLIFVSSSLPSKTKLLKDILSKLKVIETPSPVKPYEVVALTLEIAKEYGFKLQENVATCLSEKCAYNIDVIIMELEKMQISKEKGTIISQNDVEEMVPNYNVNDVFELKDAIVNKNISKALELIDEAENSKMELIPVVVMLAKEYELLYTISSLVKEKRTNDEISTILDKMHPYRVKMLRSTANKYTEEKLKQLLLYLCNLDLKCVSEDNLGFGELKKFLLEL